MQRDVLKTRGYDSKKNTGEGSFLGEGASKVVWRQNDFAVINATDEQRGINSNSTVEVIEKSNLKLKNEYNFTLYLHETISNIVTIPQVYLYKNSEYFGDNKFRYAKELCDVVKVNDALFYQMIELSERLLEAGWAYLDMKPSNLGLLDGKLCIVDTDCQSFYRIPHDLVDDFRSWIYLIVLIYTYNHLEKEVSRPVVFNFIIEKKISTDLLQRLMTKHTGLDKRHPDGNPDLIDSLSNNIIEHGNKAFKDYEQYIHLENVLLPYEFFQQYAVKGNKNLIDAFKHMMSAANDFRKAGKNEKVANPVAQALGRPSAKALTRKNGPKPASALVRPQSRKNRPNGSKPASASLRPAGRLTPRGGVRIALAPPAKTINPKGPNPRNLRSSAFEQQKKLENLVSK